MLEKKFTIPFNKPYFSGNELLYIREAISTGKISGNGFFTKKCHKYFEDKFGFKKVLLTSSCTDALEMCSLLLDIKPGDEVIVPSYTFVSSALAFDRQGAKIIFADSCVDNPNLNVDNLEKKITDKTRAIVVVHYAGIACDMDKICSISKKYNLIVIEDAAQAIHSYYKGRPLGSIGNLATFSFHETKNINSGEGGMLVINDEKFIRRSEIIWEKGTNRSEFFRGESDKYQWVDTGSSFLPSEITAAFLYAQLEMLPMIQKKRLEIWNYYYHKLKEWADKNYIKLPVIPSYATNNAHIFYLVCKSFEQRKFIIDSLNNAGILSVFHYLSLHKSLYYTTRQEINELPHSDIFTNTLVRLPLFYDLNKDELDYIISTLLSFKFE